MRHLPWLGWIGASLILALTIRYGFIEPSAIGLQCSDPVMPWWCGPREALIFIHVWNGWGIAALLCLLLYMRKRIPALLALGLTFASLGLVLYNTGIASLSFLMALYVLGGRMQNASKQ